MSTAEKDADDLDRVHGLLQLLRSAVVEMHLPWEVEKEIKHQTVHILLLCERAGTIAEEFWTKPPDVREMPSSKRTMMRQPNAQWKRRGGFNP